MANQEVLLKNGKKVIIRELKQDEDVFELCRFVKDVYENSKYPPMKQTTPEEETRWLQEEICKIKKGRAICNVAEYGKEIVGLCSIESKELPEEHTAEFGIMIRSAWRKKGLGTLLAQKTLEKGKKNKQMEIIFLKCASNNMPSLALCKNLGFKTVAGLPRFYKRGREYCDRLYMVLNK
jgi:RimJ/RimL family protein N-acetyltransferase